MDRLLPDLICQPCKTELEIAYKFHKKCDRSVDLVTDYIKKLNPQGFSGPGNYSSHLKYYGLGSNITSKYQNRFEDNDFKSYNQHNSRSLLFKIKRLRRENSNNRTLKSKSKTQILSHCLSDLSDFSFKKSNSNYSKTTVRLENLQDVNQFENKCNFLHDNKYSTTHMPLNKSDDSNCSEKSIPISISSSKNPQTISISYSSVENDPDQKLDLEIGETSLNNNASEYNRIKEEILNGDTLKIESPQRLNIISHEIVPCHLKYNLDLMELKKESDEIEKLENTEIKEEKVEEMEEFNCNEENLKKELLEIVEHDLPYTLEDANFFKQELSQQKKVDDNIAEGNQVKTTEKDESTTLNNETKESQHDKTDNISAKGTVEDKASPPPKETNKPHPLFQTPCILTSRYLCKYCDTPCHTAPGLKRHIYKFHFAKFNECKICLFTYRKRAELLEHVRTHKQRSTYAQRQYFSNKRNHYDYNSFDNPAQINRRSFTCRVCKQIFWSQFEFSRHTRHCTL